jgi:hypothetical protein
MRLAAALLAAALTVSAAERFLYSATFAYQEYPKDLWPEELVRLKAIGFNTLRVAPGSPADVVELARLARRLGLQVWVEPAAPAPELEPFRPARGGPLLDPPAGRTASVTDPARFLLGVREAWAAGVKTVDCRHPAAEHASVLARHGALVRNFGPLLAALTPRPATRWRWGEPPAAALPRGLRLALLSTPGPRGPAFVSALYYNEDHPIAGGTLTVSDPKTSRPLALRRVNLPARQALLMPLNLPLASPEVCATCSTFAPRERIVSATAELLSVAFENGVLAMEFAAPGEGELVLELARQPEGPVLAGARIRSFDWDAKTHHLRVIIPPGQPPEYRSRVGLGIQLPDTSVFLKGPQRLIVGSTAVITASFSSSDLADRARLLGPAGWRIRPERRGGAAIDYQVEVPGDAVPGDTSTFAIETEGTVAQSLVLPLARFCAVRVEPEESFHWRGGSQLAIRPYLSTTPLQRPRTYRVHLRNHSDEIRTFEVAATGAGMKFQPGRLEVVVGGGLEREVTLSASPVNGRPGLYPWTLAVRQGDHVLETLLSLAAVSPDQTLAYQLDFDRDGAPEWVLENQRVRVVVSPRQGGRLLEFTRKGRDVWGRESALGVPPAEARITGPGTLELAAPEVLRRITLGPQDDFFEVEQNGGPGAWVLEGSRGVKAEGPGARVEASSGRWRVQFPEEAVRRLRVALEVPRD